MKNPSLRNLLWLAVPMAALSFTACGTKTETEKTTVIERKVEVPVYTPTHTTVIVTEEEDGHLERAGKKIEEKAGREFDEAVDEATK